MFRRPTIFASNGVKSKSRKETRNVVIFGETGVGKSSLINLIAGEKIAATSSSAVGCTLEYRRYWLMIGNQRFAIWDTAGLDEGTQGTVPAEKAEAYLKQLLHDLAKASGIDLLVYCVRGTRVRSALLTNYHLFYSAICRKKVPIAIVVTGLENQEGNMDTWWLRNEHQFSALQMHFDNYACVTTLQPSPENVTLQERRTISREALVNMIVNTCRTEQWKPSERSWANTAFSDIRAMLASRQEHNVHVANVIMCDGTRNGPARPEVVKRSFTFHYPVTLSLAFIRSMNIRSPVSVVSDKLQSKLPFDEAIKCTPERLFRVYQVPRKPTPLRDKEDVKKDTVVKRGADLLIFCVKKEDCECRNVKSQWEYFNATYGGELSPQIVVVIGAIDQRSAEEWWNGAVDGTVTKGDASIAYWPTYGTVAQIEVAGRRLRDLVNTCCIDCSKVNFSGEKRIFRRANYRRFGKTRTLPLGIRPLVDDQMEGTLGAHQDILTSWGVWEHVSDGSRSITRPLAGAISHTSLSSGDDQEQDRLPFRPSS